MPRPTVIVSPRQVQVLRKGAKAADESGSIAAVLVTGGQRTSGAGWVGWIGPTTVGVVTRDGKQLMRSDIARVAAAGGTEVAPDKADAAVEAAIAAARRPVVLGGEVPINLISNGATTEIADTELNAGRTSSGVFKDDFLDELHARTKAQIGPNGELLDDFDQLYQLQKGQHEALVQEAQFARTNPPSVLSGGTLGNQVTVPPDGSVIPCCQWIAKSDAEVTPISVLVGPLVGLAGGAGPNDTFGFASYRPGAVLQWGSRGFQYTVIFDVARGVQFTVFGSSATLSFFLTTGSGNTPPPLKMAGQFGFGPIVRTKNITRTDNQGLTGGAGPSSANPVPTFAQSCTIVRTNATSAVTINFLDGSLNSVFQVLLPAAAQTAEVLPLNVIPLSGEIQFYKFSGTVNTNFDVIWDLAI